MLGGDPAALGPVLAVRLPRSGGRQGRAREQPRQGSFGAWIITENADVVPARSRRASALALPPVTPRNISGLARVTWSYHPVVQDPGIVAGMPDPGSLAHVSAFGYLDYVLEEYWGLLEPVAVPIDVDGGSRTTRRSCRQSLVRFLNDRVKQVGLI